MRQKFDKNILLHDENKKKSIFRKKKFLPKLDRNFMADMLQIRKNLFLERKISYGNWTGILWQISGVILEWQKKIGHLLSVAPFNRMHQISFLKC